MTSLLTNYTAMSAVRTLSATQTALAATQNQISAGLKVAIAKDNATHWSIATSMKTRIGELQAVNDGLDVTSGILSTTSAALDQILAQTQGIAKDVVAAQTAGRRSRQDRKRHRGQAASDHLGRGFGLIQ